MVKPELNRVSRELLVSGYTMTSFDELGLELDLSEVDRFCLLVEASAGSAAALEAVKHIEKRGMTIVQDPVCMELGALLLAPVVETLFADVEGARENWFHRTRRFQPDSGNSPCPGRVAGAVKRLAESVRGKSF